MSTATALQSILLEKLENGSLVLPTLPEISVNVRNMVADPNSNLKMLAELISHDASLSARMIRIANTSHYSRTVRVDNLPAALTRIGMQQIKNIATALAIEQLFVSDSELVSAYLKTSWVESTEVTVYALALLSFYGRSHRHHNLLPDALTLIALVHNIGLLPILGEADHYPEVFGHSGFLEAVSEELKYVVGAAIVKAWNFSEEAVTTLAHLDDPLYESAQVSYLDFVRLAMLCFHHQGALNELDDQLGPYIKKGMVSSVNDLLGDDFAGCLDDFRATFQ